MKVGDLVRAQYSEAIGLVVEVCQRKVCRSPRGKIDWNKIEPEPHAVVLYSHNDGTVDIPAIELEVVNESR